MRGSRRYPAFIVLLCGAPVLFGAVPRACDKCAGGAGRWQPPVGARSIGCDALRWSGPEQSVVKRGGGGGGGGGGGDTPRVTVEWLAPRRR